MNQIEDRSLAKKIMKMAQTLEHVNDAVGNTRIRQAINQRCVEIFLFARDGDLQKYPLAGNPDEWREVVKS